MCTLLELTSERTAEACANARDKNTFWQDIRVCLICLFTVLGISATMVYRIAPYHVGRALTFRGPEAVRG